MSLEEEVHEFLNGLELDPAKTEGVPEALCQFNERLPGMQLRELLLVMSHFAKVFCLLYKYLLTYFKANYFCFNKFYKFN
jgi:hypothetical protein